MHSIILAGVLDHRPQLAICRTADELRGALTAWFADLDLGLDLARADPEAIEAEIEAAMEGSDWTALECFPLLDDRLAFTGDSIGIGTALACHAEDEEAAGGREARPRA